MQAVPGIIVKPVQEWSGWLALNSESGMFALASTREAALEDLAERCAYLADLEAQVYPQAA